MVFPFAALGCFNFDPRKLSIQAIDDTERESSEESYTDAAKHKSRSCAATDDKTGNRNLVGCDSRFAKERDYRGLNWRVDVSGKIQRALLRSIQNNALSNMTFLCARRCKTEWPYMAPHAHNVIVNLGRI